MIMVHDCWQQRVQRNRHSEPNYMEAPPDKDSYALKASCLALSLICVCFFFA